MKQFAELVAKIDCTITPPKGRQLGICPECKTPDAPSLDLEDQLIEAIKSIENSN